jgi:ketosteroid isomerase-like protein
MHKFLLISLLFITAALSANAQTAAKPEPNNSAERSVLKVTQEWLTAEINVDRAALNVIIADDFLGTGPRGNIVSKKDVIPKEGTGHGLNISGQDLKVRVFGDAAIVTGLGVPKGPPDRPELRMTVVFVKRGDRWQMVSGHLSRVPPNSD